MTRAFTSLTRRVACSCAVSVIVFSFDVGITMQCILQVFNTASHFMALMLSILGSAVLLVQASLEVRARYCPAQISNRELTFRVVPQGQPWKIISFAIYGSCLIALFACSTLHHGLEGHQAMEKGLRIADFCAIFPLIAGAPSLCLPPLCSKQPGLCSDRAV